MLSPAKQNWTRGRQTDFNRRVFLADNRCMPADIDAILKIEVPLIVQVGGQRMTVREVMNLAPGAIIELPKNADDELDVLVKNRPIGLGQAVKVGENFGVRITSIGGVEQRIAALGPDVDASDDNPELTSAGAAVGGET